jgi:hypothetical protein
MQVESASNAATAIAANGGGLIRSERSLHNILGRAP